MTAELTFRIYEIQNDISLNVIKVPILIRMLLKENIYKMYKYVCECSQSFRSL